ncbi:MAG: hypothetical protein K6T85_10205 [Gorillibacterium sp.]|nr:hypothetical protein [Gorillibacterium sp.]
MLLKSEQAFTCQNTVFQMLSNLKERIPAKMQLFRLAQVRTERGVPNTCIFAGNRFGQGGHQEKRCTIAGFLLHVVVVRLEGTTYKNDIQNLEGLNVIFVANPINNLLNPKLQLKQN